MPEKVRRRFDDETIKLSPEPSSTSRKRKRNEGDGLPRGLVVRKAHRETGVYPKNPAEQTTLDIMQSPNGESNYSKNARSRQPDAIAKNKAHHGQNQRINDAGFRRPAETAHGGLKEKARKIWEQRKNLPVWSQSHAIRQSLREKDVLLLVGETGSGKSTQVPQILVKEPWCRAQSVSITKADATKENIKVGGCIAVTEPRRVAAVSLARRVAEEMGTALGSSSPASTVGYNVRFDNSTSPCTKIKYLTEGMLLQEMLRDPWLRNYSAVVVDEVHERGVNVDLVMGFLKNMVRGKCEGRGGVPLKVGVMSATVSVEGLVNFFQGNSSSLTENGVSLANAHDVSGEEDEWSGISDSDSSETKIKERKAGDSRMNGSNGTIHNVGMTEKETNAEPSSKHMESLDVSNVATCHIKGRQYPVKISYAPEPVQDFVDASLRTIFQIHYKEPLPGDILVFLTGQTAVESLEHLVTEYATAMGPEVPKLLVLPLFAALPQAAQQKVFLPASPKTRKVVLATNIAETSITVSGVRFVIDCGKSKIKQFRTRIGLDSLLVKPISKSAAIQRKGRAGREAPGECYRLYTEQAYLKLPSQNTPEILRCDLGQAVLTMKARGVTDVMNFPFLDRPPREALEKALMQLFQLKALDDVGGISQIGLEMAKLPLTVALARVLLAAAEPGLSCVPEVIDIISALSVENIFLALNSEEKEEQAQATRQELYKREGDHLTLLTTVRAYNAEHTDRKLWAEKRFVSHRAMQAVLVSNVCESGGEGLKLNLPGCPKATAISVREFEDALTIRQCRWSVHFLRPCCLDLEVLPKRLRNQHCSSHA